MKFKKDYELGNLRKAVESTHLSITALEYFQML